MADDVPQTVLTKFCQAWARQDLPGTLALAHDNVVYEMFIPQDIVLFGGKTQGKAAMSDRMQTILEQFDMLRFDVIDSKIADNAEHARVAFAFRHKVAEETISGTMRLKARVQDGLIVDFKEYHDVDKIRAFMRLVAHQAGGAIYDC